MFWRVEISEEGGIFSVERCEEKGTNGRRVIYVEAATKELACDEAKAWYERYKERCRRHTAYRQSTAKANGLCLNCKVVRPREGKTRCAACAQWQADHARGIRSGAIKPHERLSPEEAIRRIAEARRRWQKRKYCEIGRFLCGSDKLIRKSAALGDNGPLVQWIIAEQERRAAAWRAANPEPEEKAEAAE